ncbi:MAG: hypothetical protein KC609_23325, partial [Myxococcales bacterium]|nr:hypothetical protein [Myxococcales bacterium]
MNAMLKRVVLLLLLVAVGSVGFHCGTDTKFVVSDLDGSTGPKDTSQPGVDTSGGFWRVLVPSPAEYFARVQQVVKLKAIVVNSAGEHDANVTVSFKITSDNPGGASFIVGDI